jgi:hypothetical protein
MNQHANYALAHPVFDPAEITTVHGWRQGRLSFVLTVNIGME